MTKINIGTSKKNIVGVNIKKPFNEITFTDILKIVEKKFGKRKGISIHGWCNVTKKNRIK